MICILSISKVSRFYLASVAELAGLNLSCSKIPKDMFSRDAGQIMMLNTCRLLLTEFENVFQYIF